MLDRTSEQYRHQCEVCMIIRERMQNGRDWARWNLADDGARCETALATAEVAAIKANPPSFMRSRHVAL